MACPLCGNIGYNIEENTGASNNIGCDILFHTDDRVFYHSVLLLKQRSSPTPHPEGILGGAMESARADSIVQG